MFSVRARSAREGEGPCTQVDYTRESKERYGNHVWNIYTAGAVTFFLLRREANTVKKNVTLFSYMVMQHAAHLEIYPLIPVATGLSSGRAFVGKGISLIRYCGSYGTRATGA